MYVITNMMVRAPYITVKTTTKHVINQHLYGYSTGYGNPPELTACTQADQRVCLTEPSLAEYNAPEGIAAPSEESNDETDCDL
jgi:hypothetical protein